MCAYVRREEGSTQLRANDANASVRVCLHLRVCAFVCVRVHGCVCVCACLCLYVCICICLHPCLYACIHACMPTCVPCDFLRVRNSFSYSTRKRSKVLSPTSSCNTCVGRQHNRRECQACVGVCVCVPAATHRHTQGRG